MPIKGVLKSCDTDASKLFLYLLISFKLFTSSSNDIFYNRNNIEYLFFIEILYMLLNNNIY